MTQEIYNPNPGFSNPHIKDFDEYLSLYKESIENPEKFFGDLAKENISWIKDFDITHNDKFSDTVNDKASDDMSVLENVNVVLTVAIVFY